MQIYFSLEITLKTLIKRVDTKDKPSIIRPHQDELEVASVLLHINNSVNLLKQIKKRS